VTAGETWHSAGLIMQLRPSDLEIQLRARTRALLTTLQQETGLDPGWHNNGGLYVARSKVSHFIYDALYSTLYYIYSHDASTYADNTMIPTQHSDLDPVSTDLQTCIDKISNSYNKWQMTINTTKTEAKIFTLLGYSNTQHFDSQLPNHLDSC
jgi:hypothetical protein